MKQRQYLAVDLGATSGRTTLATFDGSNISLRELTRFANPMVPIAGHIHWNIVELYNQILSALALVHKQGIELDSIGIDTWGCDVAYFGAKGNLISLPYCYRGSHTEGAMEAYFERMPAAELYNRSGIQFMPFNTIFQLDAINRLGLVKVADVDKILFIPDALNYMLTGVAATEYSVATTGQIVDAQSKQLDEKVLSVAGIRKEQFGQFITPGTVLGELTEQNKHHTGITKAKVIAVAGHDTASAVAAVPVGPEAAYLSCGTWSLMGIKTESPIITEQSFAENFTNEGGVDGTIRFLKNICGLWLFERCRAEFTDAPKDVAELVALAGSVSDDFTTLINPDDPTFANPPSMIEAIDNYAERTSQRKPSTPAEYCNCIFRSLAARYREVFTLLEQFAGRRLEYLYVIGGGAQNAMLMQLTADAIGRDVVVGVAESTTMGNILMQMRALGDIEAADMQRIIAASTNTKIYKPNK
jgi:rhamnulokinase